jgi:predicted molibdopterin-dependent oxidoreductase YjgC
MITAEIAQRILSGGGREIQEAPAMGWDYRDATEILNEIATLTPSYHGINQQRLDNGECLQWPVPTLEHPGTPVLHTRGFARGKGRFMPIDHISSPELPDDDYPMILSTGRVLYHWHGGEMTRRAKGLMSVYRNALIEVSPIDAEKLGINSQQIVRVTSRRGSIESEALITDRVPPGMVYANFHFPEASANELTIADLDPVSKIPSYKVCAVKVELVADPVGG